MKNQRFLIIILVVFLALAVSYIVYDSFRQAREKDRFEAYQQGLNAGYEQAVLQLMEEAAQCTPIPIHAGNQSINMIAVECLQKGQMKE